MGKKHRNLIDQILLPENFWDAYRKASKGKRSSSGYMKFKEYDGAYLAQLRQEIKDQTYRPGDPRQFWVYEPKPRPISALPFRDRIVQHALCSVINPVFQAGFMPQSYACIQGKGTHLGAIHTQALLRRMSKTGRPVWVLKTDFSKYFHSIDKEKLWRLIEKKISCHRTLQLIETFTPRKGDGIPIGNLTSQLWANVYGTQVDRFLAQILKISTFFRYMDDIVILHHSKAVLQGVLDFMEAYCMNSLRLRFSKWSIRPASEGINFLGYRIFKTHKLLRKDSVKRAKRKMINFARHDDEAGLMQFAASFSGHAQWADSANLIKHLAATYNEAKNHANHHTNPC